jgi:hypothetical protein
MTKPNLTPEELFQQLDHVNAILRHLAASRFGQKDTRDTILAKEAYKIMTATLKGRKP